MNANNIGLKLADGEFYPVLEDGTAARKRLVVTTVQDGQPSVQIDLYRGQGPTVENATYIGSLVVEGIPSMAKGEPDIQMDLGLADDGTLTAFAQEASTGASQSLKVSLEALSEEEKYEVPDFEFSKELGRVSHFPTFSDEDFEGTDNLPPEADSAQLLADVRSEADAEEAKEKPKGRTLRPSPRHPRNRPDSPRSSASSSINSSSLRPRPRKRSRSPYACRRPTHPAAPATDAGQDRGPGPPAGGAGPAPAPAAEPNPRPPRLEKKVSHVQETRASPIRSNGAIRSGTSPMPIIAIPGFICASPRPTR